MQPDRDEDRLAGDVVGSTAPDGRSVEERWSALRPTYRRAIIGVVAGALAIAALGYGVGAARTWVADRSLADEVTLAASLGVSSSSTTPAGGTVDFYVSVLNTGARRVSVTDVRIDAPGLQISSTRVPPFPVEPSGTLVIPLSVILDCSGRPAEQPVGGLPGVINAVPASGRERDVAVTVGAAEVVTGIAQTLCRIRPDLTDLELDGPVLQTRP